MSFIITCVCIWKPGWRRLGVFYNRCFLVRAEELRMSRYYDIMTKSFLTEAHYSTEIRTFARLDRKLYAQWSSDNAHVFCQSSSDLIIFTIIHTSHVTTQGFLVCAVTKVPGVRLRRKRIWTLLFLVLNESRLSQIPRLTVADQYLDNVHPSTAAYSW